MAYTTIDKPSDYFNTKLYTGTQQAHNITGVGFAPNWVWIKKRSGADAHYIFDSVRGVDKQIQSNSSAAEYDYSGDTHRTLTAFGSDGFTLQTSEGVNHNNQTFASWNWKETATAGFDIVLYTGSGSAKTISHSLSAVPKMIIVKAISAVSQWAVQHASLGPTKWTELQSTAAADFSTTIWNDTAPTSSVFTVGTNARTNANGTTYVAYVFSEKTGYSKFGSYTGNGNADGTFVNLGFKPAFLMIKRTDSANQWIMLNNKMSLYNNNKGDEIYADSSAAQNSFVDGGADFLSNGFKLRGTNASVNVNNGSYIYMAFAKNPFVASNFNAATAR